MSCFICNFIVTVEPLGGTGCGIEITNNIVYSIGGQLVDASFEDDCCDSEVLINGDVPPVFVSDGDIIDITVNPGPNCYFLEKSDPVCGNLLFRRPPKLYKITKDRKIIINKRAILEQIKARRKSLDTRT